MSRRAVLLALGLILLVALGLRTARWAAERRDPLAMAPVGDERTYDQWGQAIARGEAPDEVPYQAPLHAYVLAAWHGVLPPDEARDAQRLLAALLGVATAALAFATARRAAGGDARAGLVAAAIVALHQPLVYYETTLLRDGPATFATALAAWILTRVLGDGPGAASSRSAWLLGAALGLVLGLGALLRENLLLVGGALALLLAWRALRARSSAGAAVVLALGLGLAAPLAPWVVHNARLEGSVSPLVTWNGGCVFYLANRRANPGPGYAAPPFVPAANPEGEVIGFRREALRRTGRELTPHEISRYWLGQGLREVAADPVAYAGKVSRRALYYVASRELVHARDPLLDAEGSWVLRLPLPGLGIFVGFAALGALAGWRRLEVRGLCLLLAALFATTVPIAFATRYRLPAVPLVAVLGALGLRHATALLEVAVRTSAPRRASLGLAALAVGLACTAIPVPYAPSQAGISRWNRVMAWMELGRPEAAFAELEQLPSGLGVSAWGRFGEVLAQNDELELATRAYRRALELDPGEPRGWLGLGRVHARAGRSREATGALEHAVELAPRYAPAWAALAAVRLEAGQVEEALDAARRARRLAPEEEAFRRLERAARARRGDG